MTEEYINVSMGSFLFEEFLKPLNLSQSALAKAIGVPSGRINEIVNNKRKLTADTDLRLCKYFGMSEGFFLRVQYDIDLILAKRLIEKELATIVPYKETSNVSHA
jgi:addiction module HigA family antidote